MEGPHSPAFRAPPCFSGCAPQCVSRNYTAPPGEASEAWCSVPSFRAKHPEQPTPSRLLSSFSTDASPQTSLFSSLGSAYFQLCTRAHSRPTAHRQPLGKCMPHQLLTAFPKSACPSRLTSKYNTLFNSHGSFN